MRADLPAGVVTFVFTDVEGSTRLLHGLGEAAYAELLAEHRRALREAFGRQGGVEVDTQGDAFFFAFPAPEGALQAADEGVRALDGGPARVRVGVHTGTAVLTAEGYVGADVHRAARIAAAGSGGQILVSRATAERVDRDRFPLVDLGDHRFKDLLEPERVYQLGDGAFAPIRSLYRASLPVPPTPFVGRRHELMSVVELLRSGSVSLLSLTGPGGTGKTRLALQAAAEATDAFPDGVWWVPLAPLSDPELVMSRIAQVLGVPEGHAAPLVEVLAERLGGKRLLLLLDNAEHLLPRLASDLAALLSSVAGPTLLVTSRERLRLAAEHEFPVPAMQAEDAVELFVASAAAVGVTVQPDAEVEAVCERLDRLPLALRLAAPRLKLFSVHQLLERLSSRLDLLRGDRDADPRQATLRATIEWSYGLLTEEERVLLDRLSVFAGSCTLEAAEAVAGADPDVLQGLVDKSMAQIRTDAEPRLALQSVIREFAAERLEERGDGEAIRRAHARWYRDLAERADAMLLAGEPEELAVAQLDAEIDNLRAAVEWGAVSGDPDLVRRITAALPMYWTMRDRYVEARAWLERALAMSPAEDAIRVRLLVATAATAYRLGDHAAAIEASDAAADLAMRLGGVTDRFQDLRRQAGEAWRAGDRDEAERVYLQAIEAAVEVNNGVGISACRLSLSWLANETGRHERAESLLQDNLRFVRGRGQSRCEAFTLAGLAETALLTNQPAEAAGWAVGAATRALGFGEESLAAYCLDIAAAALAEEGAVAPAAAILDSTDRARRRLGIVPDDEETAMRERGRRAIDAAGAGEPDRARSEGTDLSLPAALELAFEARPRGPSASAADEEPARR
jgi:predicted ATPase/class 3 adenylate cyclase